MNNVRFAEETEFYGGKYQIGYIESYWSFNEFYESGGYLKIHEINKSRILFSVYYVDSEYVIAVADDSQFQLNLFKNSKNRDNIYIHLISDSIIFVDLVRENRIDVGLFAGDEKYSDMGREVLRYGRQLIELYGY